jgi:hypothetical protein
MSTTIHVSEVSPTWNAPSGLIRKTYKKKKRKKEEEQQQQQQQ